MPEPRSTGLGPARAAPLIGQIAVPAPVARLRPAQPVPPAIVKAPVPVPPAPTASPRGLTPAERALFQGPPGPPGPQGLPGDYGYIRYGEMIGATPRAIPANTVVPFVVQPPIQVTDQLRPPFSGFIFLGQDGVFRGRSLGDVYLLTVQFSAVTAVVNGYVRIDIGIAGNQSGVTGPLKQRTVLLPNQPGVSTQVEEEFTIHAQSGFVANGATIDLFASVPVAVSADLIYIDPRTAGS